MNKRILIIIGDKRAALTEFMLAGARASSSIPTNNEGFNASGMLERDFSIIYNRDRVDYDFVKRVVEGEDIIVERKNEELYIGKIDINFIFHLDSKRELKEIPAGIIKRSYIFNVKETFKL